MAATGVQQRMYYWNPYYQQPQDYWEAMYQQHYQQQMYQYHQQQQHHYQQQQRQHYVTYQPASLSAPACLPQRDHAASSASKVSDGGDSDELTVILPSWMEDGMEEDDDPVVHFGQPSPPSVVLPSSIEDDDGCPFTFRAASPLVEPKTPPRIHPKASPRNHPSPFALGPSRATPPGSRSPTPPIEGSPPPSPGTKPSSPIASDSKADSDAKESRACTPKAQAEADESKFGALDELESAGTPLAADGTPRKLPRRAPAPPPALPLPRACKPLERRSLLLDDDFPPLKYTPKAPRGCMSENGSPMVVKQTGWGGRRLQLSEEPRCSRALTAPPGPKQLQKERVSQRVAVSSETKLIPRGVSDLAAQSAAPAHLRPAMPWSNGKKLRITLRQSRACAAAAITG